MRVECQFEPWLQEMFSALDFMARDGRWGAINSFLAEQGAGDHPGYPIAILRCGETVARPDRQMTRQELG
jgi:hypothetical protein